MSKLGYLHVRWIADESCWDGGFYSICQANGHLFLIAAQKGSNERVREQLQELCDNICVLRLIQGALNTEEEGDNLVSVAREAHRSEQELAAMIKKQEEAA